MEQIDALIQARQLLAAAQFAMNKIPNTPIGFGAFDKTYDLAAAIDRFFANGGAA